MEIHWWVMAAVGGMVAFMLISKSFVKPLWWLWYSLLYTAIGSVVLFLLNLAGDWVDFRIPINPVTSLITGILGVPGVLCLIAVKVFLIHP
ncbi:pro-sigmaK processing inhibitor BofA family protein [Melghirimyces algeriensis]|uniref:Inhibitor of the pro-sigma K processing machinery n=1 Tax=Melghirimyces algeriensis TaxID=910412 RepID=A0A521FBC0_9BACL|nr:pro-sigmaK processing inhibitor BofA family protein [Melghirimyces algeriensis]SMO93443.1 inhibitor of the pro-sigma K processing machinery [Melghirimyces algeriensis]